MKSSTPASHPASSEDHVVGKRRTQAALRRELLLETALRLFSEHGYRGTSVRDVTRAAGVTEAVLYHYFTNKADLLTSVLARYAPFSQIPHLLDATVDATVDGVLRQLGKDLLGLLRARRQLVLTVLSEAPTDSDLADVLGRFHRRVAEDLGGFLERRRVDGQVSPDVDVLAVARAFQGGLLAHFLATTFGTEQQAVAPDDEAAVDGLVSALTLGILPRRLIRESG